MVSLLDIDPEGEELEEDEKDDNDNNVRRDDKRRVPE